MTRDRARLLEILDAIARIRRYTAGGRAAFLSSEVVQDSVTYRIGNIGESVKGLSTPFRDRHPDVAWKQIAGMRDVVNHNYASVDLDVVWATVERDLPHLERAIERILASDRDV